MMRRGVRVLVILALLAPLSAMPGPPSRAPAPEGVPVETHDVYLARDVDSDAWSFSLSSQEAQIQTLGLIDSRLLLDSTSADSMLYKVQMDVEYASTTIQTRAGTDSEALAAESVPMIFMANAQGTLAALGGASHAATESMVVREVAAAFLTATMPAEFAIEPPAAWMVAAFWAVFLTALGALALPRSAGIGAWTLYARLAQSELERHPRRQLVLGLIRNEPGLTVVGLERGSGVKGGALRHHLDQLERHGLARCVRNGRTTHWFPATGLPVHAPPTDAQQRVLDALREAPPSTVRDLAARLDVTVQNVWKQLKRLDDSRLVRSERAGRSVRWALPA